MADLDHLLPAIAAGDVDAFGRWLAGAEPELRASLRGFAAVVDCEAVLQESLLRVWQLAPRVVSDGKPNALLRFAVRVARNLGCSEARRFRAAPLDEEGIARTLDEAAVADAPEGPDPLLRKAIEECQRTLPEKPAAALSLRIAVGGAESDEALAVRLGMRLNTFLQNVTRARRLLAACLEGRGVVLAAVWR